MILYASAKQFVGRSVGRGLGKLVSRSFNPFGARSVEKAPRYVGGWPVVVVVAPSAVREVLVIGGLGRAVAWPCPEDGQYRQGCPSEVAAGWGWPGSGQGRVSLLGLADRGGWG